MGCDATSGEGIVQDKFHKLKLYVSPCRLQSPKNNKYTVIEAEPGRLNGSLDYHFQTHLGRRV